jgi:hypothetical protein
MGKVKMLWATFLAHTIGIKTPMGFRVRPQAYMTLKSMNDELVSLRSRYDYAMETNAKQAASIDNLQRHYDHVFNDARRYSRALKELSKRPVVVSAETLDILEGFKEKA